MNDILEELSAMRRADAAGREKTVSLSAMEKAALAAPPPRGFAAALKRPGATGVIAELKKASPSEGLIRGDFRPAELAQSLEAAGASALSVLCEPHRFLGSEDYLREARSRVSIPVIYKDFITTRYQLAAARAAGADAALLIVAVLKDAELKALLEYAVSLGLDALVETHGRDEILRASDAGATLVGVNCRNLRNFTTDVSLLEKLVGEIPGRCVRVAESGMHTHEALSKARAAGADGFLVGTALMRSPRPDLKLKELVSATNNN